MAHYIPLSEKFSPNTHQDEDSKPLLPLLQPEYESKSSLEPESLQDARSSTSLSSSEQNPQTHFLLHHHDDDENPHAADQKSKRCNSCLSIGLIICYIPAMLLFLISGARFHEQTGGRTQELLPGMQPCSLFFPSFTSVFQKEGRKKERQEKLKRLMRVNRHSAISKNP